MSDLISRSALLEEVKSLTVTVTGLRAGKGILHEYAKQYRDTLLRIINEQPASEAAQEVHGKWIRNENPIEISCECSVCHAKDYWYDIDKANEYYWFHRKFCPNCGAKMDGGSDQ